MLGLIGRKIGMSRVFTPEGVSIPVTVIQVMQNRVVQLKDHKKDGYSAVQLTFGVAKRRESVEQRRQNGRTCPEKINKRKTTVNKPLCGHYDAHVCEVGETLKEFHVTPEEFTALQSRPELKVSLLSSLKKVDISGTSAGKGFAGTIKRWNFHSQPASHGNSLSHRVPGSIGQNQTPGRVFPGKKMPGHLGCQSVTIKNSEIIDIDEEHSLLMVKGAVPGVSGGVVLIKPSRGESSILSKRIA